MNFSHSPNHPQPHFSILRLNQALPWSIYMDSTQRAQLSFNALSYSQQQFANWLQYQNYLLWIQSQSLDPPGDLSKNHASACKFETKTEETNEESLTLQANLSTTCKVEESQCEFEDEELLQNKIEETSPSYENLSLKEKITQIFSFVETLDFDNLKSASFQSERKKYYHNEPKKNLIALFDLLIDKFAVASKCREDMLRYVMRKAWTSISKSYSQKNKILLKEATTILCKQYFKDKYEEFAEQGGIEDKDFVSLLLPYKKDSKNKTASSEYIRTIFASEEFFEDYVKFLDRFDDIILKEKVKKTAKLIDFLVDRVENNTLDKAKYFPRFPWLDKWNKTTKTIAIQLKDTRGNVSTGRKPSEEKKRRRIHE